MKQTKTKLLCLLLATLMLLSSLTACGKDKEKDSNLIKLGDYELLYKGASIMEDSDGNDAIVLTLDFTNNSKENASGHDQSSRGNFRAVLRQEKRQSYD